ncbi:hypothetical protein [Paenarthrobacter aurescens]|uniref:hypothetical protein n=1 Tax=Paenarthrobacter aurescens TaxID=43663 RepID=UPI0021C0E90B|nr:hypothetical protein [Paenarthrobacter aurescens]MCT9868244.1 hypothetical protein [Paenarthrobacter aurescens]
MNIFDQQALTQGVIEFLDLDLNEVWVAQLAVGGNAGFSEFYAYCRSDGTLTHQDRDAVSHAVNELVADLGGSLRVPYSMDEETRPQGAPLPGS